MPIKRATKLGAILSGVAGEYFVAAEMSRQGYIASITLRNTRGVDLLATNEAGTRTVNIQVKTNKGIRKVWLVGAKAETYFADDLFYVFVNLNGLDGAPEYHVVPSKTVARFCKRHHRKWIKGAKRDGSARKDTNLRTFRDPECDYRSAWDQLGLDA